MKTCASNEPPSTTVLNEVPAILLASRRTAGDAGFFDLSHTFDGGPQVALKRSNGVLLAKMGDGVGITPFCGPADLDRVRRRQPRTGPHLPGTPSETPLK